MKILNPTIGGDIETFIQNQKTGKIITAEGIIKGTKHDPYHFDPENKYYATSLDCTSGEFNIPPCTSAGEYYLAIQHALAYINSILPQDYKAIPMAAVEFDADQLQTETANTYGCSPSLNCWTLNEIRPQPNGSNLRVSGNHIHCGYENHSFDTNIELAKAMDLYLGVPSIILEPENLRKSSGYGVSGSIRMQSYGGVEYRTLSAYFASSQGLIEWCFNQTQKAIEFVNNGRIQEIENFGEEIQHCINNNDKEMAKGFIEQYNLELV